MWRDVDPRALPLSTSAMCLLFGPFIIAAAYFKCLRLVMRVNHRSIDKLSTRKHSKPLEMTQQSLCKLVDLVAQFGLIMAYCYCCEHYPPFAHAKKEHSMDFYLASFVFLIILASFTRKKGGEGEVLNRPQTEEWKGWMQFLFLSYHWSAVGEAYNVVRVLITCYVWMTGFGNFSFFYMKSDFSCVRMIQMLWRLNMLVLFLCLTMSNSYMLYYICPLHTFYFLFVFVTMYIFKKVNHSRSWIRVKLGVAACVIWLIFDCPSTPLFTALFFWVPSRPALCLTLTDTVPCPVGGYGCAWEWYFRSGLDHWSTIFGMIFALNFPVLKRWFMLVESLPTKWEWLVKGSVGACLGIAVVLWVQNILLLPKTEYNAVHAYYGMIPVLAYIYFRNISLRSRSFYLELLCSGGKITLETYLLQHHIWLTSNAKTLLSVIPNYPLVNLVVVGSMYIFVSQRVFRITMQLRGMLLPNALKSCLLNLGAMGVALGVSFLGAAVVDFLPVAAAIVRIVIVTGVGAVLVTLASNAPQTPSLDENSAIEDSEKLIPPSNGESGESERGTALEQSPPRTTASVSSEKKMQFQTAAIVGVGVLCFIIGFVLRDIEYGNEDEDAEYVAEPVTHPDLGSMSHPWFGLLMLAAASAMLFTMDNYAGLAFYAWKAMLTAKLTDGVLSWEKCYGPLHKKMGIPAPPELPSGAPPSKLDTA